SAGEIIPYSISVDVSIYPYKGTVSTSMMGIPISLDIPMNVWYCWVALVLIVVGGILGILGSIMHVREKMVLAAGGALALLSILIFAVGLQSELSSGMSTPLPMGMGTLQLPELGLFSSGSFIFMDVPINYSTYLSFGFWLALVAAILMFVAIKKAEEIAPVPTPVAAPPPP
ncbi:MAG: hypothetical protein QXH87_01065, partial [Candidatus Bathyarchaeia archaeon]